MRKKLAMALTAAMVSAALSVPSMGAPSGNGGMLNYLNVIIMPIDDNYSSTDFIQATLTPDDGAQAAKAQSCSGQIAATNFFCALRNSYLQQRRISHGTGFLACRCRQF